MYINIYIYDYICACVCLEMGYPPQIANVHVISWENDHEPVDGMGHPISGKPQEMYIDVGCQPLKKNIPISD